MRRETVYPGQVLPETVLLNMGRDMMTGMGKLMQDILGSGPCVSGFACTPTAPASLQVNIAPGNIYAMQSVEASPWSTLPGDTAHTILKQGILPDPVSLTLTPPTATGLAINYLVQVTYQDQDINPAVLPYYNSANPSQPFTGQGNNGQSQATARDGVAVVSLKAGIAAPSGNQQTPAPDTGNVGLWVITVLNGQTTVTAQHIAAMPGAPYINPSMLGMTPSLLQSPAQFDKSTKLATTEFVQRALGNVSGCQPVYYSGTLTAAQLGQLLQVGGAQPLSLGLPVSSSIVFGSRYMLYNASTYPVTISAGSGDGLFAMGSGVTRSCVLGPGDSAEITLQAAGVWVFSGSQQLQFSSVFAAALSGDGWQRLPSGLIIQFQNVLSPVANGVRTTFNFPSAFTKTHLCTVLTAQDTVGDITVSATYEKVSLSQWRLAVWTGADTLYSAIHIGW